MPPIARTCCVARGPRRHWLDPQAWQDGQVPGPRDSVILPIGAHIPRAKRNEAICHRLIVFDEPKRDA